MRIWLSFPAIAFLLSVLSGCSLSSRSPSKLDTILPQKIGQFNRTSANESSGSGFTADYYKPGAGIFCRIDLEETSEAAQKKVKSREFCDGKSDIKILKEDILRDKTGQGIGNILICRKPPDDLSTIRSNRFMMILANDKNYILLDARFGGPSGLLELAQALPVNSQVDFAALNMHELIAENPSTGNSPAELIKLNPPLQLAAKPYLKGKVLIVEQSPSDFDRAATPSVVERPERYDLTKEMMTQSITQAGTVIQIKCGKGKKINEYVTQDAEKKRLPVYAIDCAVSVIDKTIPAIIAQKNFVGDFFIGSEKRTVTFETEFYAFPPTSEIADFIKKLPKR